MVEGINMNTQKEIDARNNYCAFTRGWKDGANVTEMRKPFANLVAYCDGYEAGRRSRTAAHEEASKRFGYEPSVTAC